MSILYISVFKMSWDIMWISGERLRDTDTASAWIVTLSFILPNTLFWAVCFVVFLRTADAGDLVRSWPNLVCYLQWMQKDYWTGVTVCLYIRYKITRPEYLIRATWQALWNSVTRSGSVYEGFSHCHLQTAVFKIVICYSEWEKIRQVVMTDYFCFSSSLKVEILPVLIKAQASLAQSRAM